MKARVKKAGWAHGRADKIDPKAAREILIRHSLKSAAEKAVSARLDHEAIDKIMANWYQILPSREVRTQKLYSVKAPTVTFTAGQGLASAGILTGASLGREDMAGLTTKKSRGWTGNPVGRPRIERECTKSIGRAALLKRRLRFDQIPPPTGVSAIDWGMFRLSYVDGFTSVDLAERFNLRPEVVRKRLSRARKAAALPK